MPEILTRNGKVLYDARTGKILYGEPDDACCCYDYLRSCAYCDGLTTPWNSQFSGTSGGQGSLDTEWCGILGTVSPDYTADAAGIYRSTPAGLTGLSQFLARRAKFEPSLSRRQTLTATSKLRSGSFFPPGAERLNWFNGLYSFGRVTSSILTPATFILRHVAFEAFGVGYSKYDITTPSTYVTPTSCGYSLDIKIETTFVGIFASGPTAETLEFNTTVTIDGTDVLTEDYQVGVQCNNGNLCEAGVLVVQGGDYSRANWGTDSLIEPSITVETESWL